MFGIIKSITPIGFLGDILNKLFVDKDKELDYKIAQQRVLENADNIIGELAKVEAQSQSFFQRGWRPALGWTYSLIILFTFLVAPLLDVRYGVTIPVYPETVQDFGLILLGLYGSQRTLEKIYGRSR